MSADYEPEVFAWGSAKPWEGRRNVNNKDVFSWADIRSNGLDDVLDMPLLHRKPCFGRPEYFVRHGRKQTPPMMIKGKSMRTKTKCGRCPIYPACRKLCTERIKSDPGMRMTLSAWHVDSVARHSGSFVYTAESGRFWTQFLKAVASRSPFYNVNDERLREEERIAAQARLEILRMAKHRQREAERRRRASDRSPPMPEFMVNATAERVRRRDQLLLRAGDPSLPACISKIRPSDAAKTSSITANVWLQLVILEAEGREPRPGSIARRMFDQGLSDGLGYATLKARVSNDLNRVAVRERRRIWAPFDPEVDVDTMVLGELKSDDAD